jgi:AcrR family transcriptional regulator
MADKAEQIRKAAEKLFATGRFHEITLDEICKRAGVGKGTIYRYFEDKEDLLYQVILAGLDEHVEAVRFIGEYEDDPPTSGLRKVARCTADFFTERSALFGLMHGEQLRGSTRRGKVWKQWRAKSRVVVDVVAGFIEKGIQSGLYASPLSAVATAELFGAMIRAGLWHGSNMHGHANWPEAVVQLLEKGLLARDK